MAFDCPCLLLFRNHIYIIETKYIRISVHIYDLFMLIGSAARAEPFKVNYLRSGART